MIKIKRKKYLSVGVSYVLALLLAKFLLSSTPVYLSNSRMNGINLVPFGTVLEYIHYFDHYNTSIIVRGILMLFIFAPVSVFVAADGEITKKSAYMYFLSLSALFSILSRVLKIGVFDIDTLILRFIVAVLFYNFTKLIFSRRAVVKN